MPVRETAQLLAQSSLTILEDLNYIKLLIEIRD